MANNNLTNVVEELQRKRAQQQGRNNAVNVSNGNRRDPNGFHKPMRGTELA